MHVAANTLDDLLQKALGLLLKNKVRITAKKGSFVEMQGVTLELARPRARLSGASTKGHVFSCFGEFVWYVSCKNELEPIRYYLPDYTKYAEEDGTVWGAYGPRMFGGDKSQYEVVKDLLSERSTSRQAVIQLFDRKDILADYNDVPCTCTLQFMIRDGVLNLIVHMRSNDAFLGLPHDIFAFTMIQEILARDLGVALGTYKHMVGSFHLYDKHREKAARYLEEGYQPTREMPEMPTGSQWNNISHLFQLEDALRTAGVSAVPHALRSAESLSDYWADVARLLAIYALTKNADGAPEKLRQIVDIRRSMSNQFYNSYIRRRSKRLQVQSPLLLDLVSQTIRVEGGTT